MQIKTLTLTMQSDRTIKENASKLRGFFATQFNDYILLHQHDGDKFVYSYPLVQYKMLKDIPAIISIKEGVDVLIDIYNRCDRINLNGSIYQIVEKGININKSKFGICTGLKSYTFLIPWLALNDKNYKRYKKLNVWKEKKKFLSKMLIGNLISLSKGLNYTVEGKIDADIEYIKEVKTSLKGTPMLGFLGNFKVNFDIPDYFGIGKSVSRGFGTVKRIAEG